jgi:hypothetical protein
MRPKLVALLATLVLLATSAASQSHGIRVKRVRKTGKGHVNTSMKGLRCPVLEGFRLAYDKGDHPVNRLGVKTTARRTGREITSHAVTGWLMDKNGGERMRMEAAFVEATDPARARTEPDLKNLGCVRWYSCGSTTCTIDLVPPSRDQKNYRWALTSFDIYNKNKKRGVERQIRTIHIRPKGESKLEMWTDAREGFGKHSGWRMLVGVSFFRAPGAATKTLRNVRSKKSRKRTIKLGTIDAKHWAIRGFELRFLNGHHNLQEMRIERKGKAYYARFNDRNTDDPIRVTVDLISVGH